MASPVDPDCLKTFQDLKLRKKLKYIIFKIDKSKIIVDKTSETGDYEEFLTNFPKNECRWAVYDLQFEKDGAQRNKLVFYSWSPETNEKPKDKFAYATSTMDFRRSLDGIGIDIQGTDDDEVTHEAVLEKAHRTVR